MAPTADVLDQLFTNQYLAVVSFTILYFDYFLTLPHEIERYWGHRLTWPSFFFFLNRYCSLFGHVLVALQEFYRTSETVCSKLQLFHQFFAVASQLIVGALLILRTYALYGRARWVMNLLCGIAFTAFVFSMWAIFGHKSEDVYTDTGGYCDSSLTANQGKWLLVPWAGMLGFDAVVFGLTVRKSLQAKKIMPRYSLFDVLLRDGAIYFFVFAGCNFANICTFAFGEILTRGCLTTFCNVLSETLISRLMLNVRDPAVAHQETHSSSRTLRTRSWPLTSDSSTGSDGQGRVSTFVHYHSPPNKLVGDPNGISEFDPDSFIETEHHSRNMGDIELTNRLS